MSTSISIPGPLRGARFVDRPNAFQIRAVLEPDETVVSAQLADPGRLSDALVPGARLWLRPGPDARTPWIAQVSQTASGVLVGLDPSRAPALVQAAIEEETLDELYGWHIERADYPIGRSRADFLLSTYAGDKMVLQVMHASWVAGGLARVPEAPNDRAARQIQEIRAVTDQAGWHATIVFVVQRNDAERLVAAPEIDPAFARALYEADMAGVRLMARRCQLTLEEVMLGVTIPVHTVEGRSA